MMGKCELLKEVAENWGLEVKEQGRRVLNGDLCVGVLDCSKFSEFAKLNRQIKKEDWEEAEEMVRRLEEAEKAGGVVSTWNNMSAIKGGNILATSNKKLHSKVVKKLREFIK